MSSIDSEIFSVWLIDYMKSNDNDEKTTVEFSEENIWEIARYRYASVQ